MNVDVHRHGLSATSLGDVSDKLTVTKGEVIVEIREVRGSDELIIAVRNSAVRTYQSNQEVHMRIGDEG